jgi:hypothetical protein
MRLPNFICIGTQKAGTTLLYEILKQHPQIFLPNVKEVHFFDVDQNYDKGLEWYKQFFDDSENYKIVGDITPAYIYFKDIPQRIQETLGTDVKLLAMLRNPVDRAYSHYWMAFRRGYEDLPFEEAIKKEDLRIKKGYPNTHRFSYISRGFYSEQMKRYLSVFSENNIMVIIFEEFINNLKANVQSILDFLSCTSTFIFEIPDKIHSGCLNLREYIDAAKINKYYFPQSNLINIIKLITSKNQNIDYPPLKKKTRLYLLDLYKNDIHKLEILLKRDLLIWRE